MKVVPYIFLILSTTLGCFAHETKAIIFDCDGTLVDTEEVQFQGWKSTLEKEGYPLSVEGYLDMVVSYALFGHPNYNQVISKLASQMVGRDCASDLLDDVSTYFDRMRDEGFPPIEPTVNFLHELAQQKKDLGLKIGLASGGTKEQILNHLRNLGVEDYFDVILSGYDDLGHYCDAEGTNKPKPYVYMEVAKRLGLVPEECIAIEDSQPGVISAVGAGCFTVAVPSLYTSHQDLSKADHLLESFNGLTPTEFLQMIELIKDREPKDQ